MTGFGCHLQLFANTPDAPVRWRLLSGNNREIARGADMYPDAESCRIAVKELQVSVEELRPAVRQNEVHRWVWQLRDQHGPVVTSAHSYDRQIRCTTGLGQAVAALPLAEIGVGVMISQARRWSGGAA